MRGSDVAKSVYNITNFAAGELSPRLAGRVDVPIYGQGCDTLENFLVYPQGGITKRPGTYYIASVGDSDYPVKLIEFEYSTTQTYVLELGHQYIRFFADGGQVLDGGSPYEIVSPFDGDDLFDIQYGQTNDVIYLTHPDYPPQILVRNDHTDWTISDVDFYVIPFLDKNDTATTITPNAATGNITLTASTNTFNANHVGTMFKLEGDKVVSKDCNAENLFTDGLELDYNESIVIVITGTWAGTVTLQRSYNGSDWSDHWTGTNNTVFEITENEDNIYYRVGIKTGDYTSGTAEVSLTKRNQAGWATITGYTNAKNVSATVDVDFANTDATTDWYEGAWSDHRGYPACFTFNNQRAVYASTDYEPQAWWASAIDDFENFDPGDINDDDAFGFTIYSKDVNKILWLFDARALFAGTAAAEWKLSNVDEGLSPTSPSVNKQSTYGSARLQAIGTGNSIVFVQAGERKLRAMNYDLQINGWSSTDLTMRSEHLFREGDIVDWAYAETPDKIFYLVLGSGDIVAFTYDTETDTLAFYKIVTTNGMFESVCTMREADRDEVWVVVKRTIDGTDYRYIEQFQSTFWTDQREYIFMDSALTYIGTPKTTISGLSHLEGEEVDVLVDGAVHAPCTVTSGVITLQSGYEGSGAYAVVHAGLTYSGIATTMRLHPQTEIGSSLGKPQVITDVELLVEDSMTFKIGSSVSDTRELELFEYPSMSTAPTPYTGPVTADYDWGWDDENFITILSDSPLPVTVLSMAVTTEARPQ